MGLFLVGALPLGVFSGTPNVWKLPCGGIVGALALKGVNKFGVYVYTVKATWNLWERRLLKAARTAKSPSGRWKQQSGLE